MKFLPSTNFEISFPPSNVKFRLGTSDMFQILRDMGMGPYWQTMQFREEPAGRKCYSFDTTHQLVTITK